MKNRRRGGTRGGTWGWTSRGGLVVPPQLPPFGGRALLPGRVQREVSENEGVEGLRLGADGDVPLHGEVGEELFHLRGAHRRGVAKALGRLVEVDIALGPADVALFGAVGVVAGAQGLADAIEEFHGGALRGGFRRRPGAIRAGRKASGAGGNGLSLFRRCCVIGGRKRGFG